MRRTIAAAVAVLACAAPTQLTNVQLAPEPRAKVKNVLVVGLFKDPAARHAYETDMVKSLQAAGAQAQASEALMPPGSLPTREDVQRLVQERQFDGVAVGHMVDSRTSVQANPTVVEPGFYGWYGPAATMAYGPALSTTTQVVVQTRVFSAATGQPEFAASSETIDPNSAAEIAEAHANLVVGALKKNGVV